MLDAGVLAGCDDAAVREEAPGEEMVFGAGEAAGSSQAGAANRAIRRMPRRWGMCLVNAGRLGLVPPQSPPGSVDLVKLRRALGHVGGDGFELVR